MNILAIGAHPDDLEILAGGTMLRYGRAGHAVVMCTVATGDRGGYECKPGELAAVRAAEARAAAEIAGADWVTLGVSDGEVRAADRDQRMKMTDLIRAHKPDAVITHHPEDYHPDHREAAKLVLDSAYMAAVPLLKTAHEAHPVPFPIFYMDTVMGLAFQPTEFVDVSDVFEDKMRMMRAHRSQVEWLNKHDGIDIMEVIKTSGAYRGLQCNRPYAEGFSQALQFPRCTTWRVLP